METKENGLEDKLTFGDLADKGIHHPEENIANMLYIGGNILKVAAPIVAATVLVADAMHGKLGLDTVGTVANEAIGYAIGYAMKMYGEKYYEHKGDISPQ